MPPVSGLALLRAHLSQPRCRFRAGRTGHGKFLSVQVYVIGDVGILEELDLKGYQHLGGPEDNDQKIVLSPGYAMEHDHDVSGMWADAAPICFPCKFCANSKVVSHFSCWKKCPGKSNAIEEYGDMLMSES